MTRIACVAIIGIGCSTANLARAVEPEAHSSLGPVSYSAGPGCPDEAEFWRQVATHLEGAPKPTNVRPIQVEALELEASGMARVTFAGEGGSRDVRELSAASCAEAVAAAGLVVALALDARGDQAAPPPSAAKAEPSPRKPSSVPRSATPPPATPNSGALLDSADSPSNDRRRLQLLFGGGGFIEYTVAPTPLFGGSAFVGISGDRQRWDARAGFAYSRTGAIEREAQRADFSFMGARLDGCAFPFVESERFALHPCLGAALGAVQSHGDDSELYIGADESTFWAAGGPLIRARQLFSELALELHAGPWIRFAGTRTFVFRGPGGDLDFHEVPPVGFTAGASLVFRVP